MIFEESAKGLSFFARKKAKSISSMSFRVFHRVSHILPTLVMVRYAWVGFLLAGFWRIAKFFIVGIKDDANI